MESEMARVRARLAEEGQRVESAVQAGLACVKTQIQLPLFFRYRNAALGQAFPNADERAFLINFVAKHQELPEFHRVEVSKDDSGLRFTNLAHARHCLTEYRPMIANQHDAIYYKNIHRFCRRRLSHKDPHTGTAFSVLTSDSRDITDSFQKLLDESHRGIGVILKSGEFDYLYNGVLQHSDSRFSERHAKDYHSGELNYLLFRHALLLNSVKGLLFPYYVCCSRLMPNFRRGDLSSPLRAMKPPRIDNRGS